MCSTTGDYKNMVKAKTLFVQSVYFEIISLLWQLCMVENVTLTLTSAQTCFSRIKPLFKYLILIDGVPPRFKTKN
jgi:hypothetical protein